MKEIINLNNTEITAEYQEAMRTHQRILANGEICAASLLEICKDLKKMRDEKLYEEFGYSSFEEYSEKAVNIKSRQAYTYISTYERLGSSVLQSNASIGITKLELLAGINPIERTELLDSGKIEGMSVAEVKELVKKCNDQGEQINMLSQENQKLKSDIEDTADEDIEAELSGALEEIENLKNALAEKEKSNSDTAEIPESVLNKIKEDAAAEAKNNISAEIEKAVSKAKAEKEAEIKKAVKAAEKEAAEKLKEKMRNLEQSKTISDEHAAELEKKLQLSDGKSATATVYISAIQDDFNKLFGVISSMGEEQQMKFKSACQKLLNGMLKMCGD